MLMETKDGWRLLTVPSAFEMGLSDCRWVYRLGQRTVTVSATVCGDEPAMQWRVTVEGPRCRFLVFGHLVLGEQEFGPAGRIEIELEAKALHFPAGSRRSLGPAISRGCLSPRDEHARTRRSHRRRRTALRRRQAPQRRIRRDPHAADERIRVRGRRLDDRPKAGRCAGVKIRQAGRRSGDAQARRSLLAKPYARRSGEERQEFGGRARRRHDLPLARA